MWVRSSVGVRIVEMVIVVEVLMVLVVKVITRELVKGAGWCGRGSCSGGSVIGIDGSNRGSHACTLANDKTWLHT